MRSRAPATVASIVLAACALALLGIVLAFGDGRTDVGRRIGKAAVGRDYTVGNDAIARRRRPRQVRHRRALAPRKAIAGHAEPLAPAKSTHRARRRTALSAAIPLGHHGGGGASPPSPIAQPGPRTTRPDPSEPAAAPTGNLPVSVPASPSPPSGSTPVPGRTSALYWGASIGPQLTGEQAPWDMDAVTKFEQIADKELSLVNFFAPFANCSTSPCSFYKFPTGPMESIREHGAIPVYSWASQSIPSRLSEPNFQLSDVIAGTYDSFIRRFAEDARDWGHPFFLRFNWEMNGNWFPWSEGVNGNQPGEFVAAWRHVHDIFATVGATNATWVWCPNVDFDGVLHDLGSLYPGDAYVDWTGLDGYNWGLNPAKPDRWRSFNELYSETYHRIVDALAPQKPMLIGEMGSTEEGGSKADWIEEALDAIPVDYPMIRGLLWFDTYDDGMDWPIETSPSSAGAFAEAIQSPAYVTEAEASPEGGPIAPPE